MKSNKTNRLYGVGFLRTLKFYETLNKPFANLLII